MFYAYSDPQAGEIGTVYQACNWLYIGAGIGRAQNTGQPRTVIVDPSGRGYSERWMRHRGLTAADIRTRTGWRIEQRPPKHKYVWLQGSRRERRRMLEALRYPVLDYPKRDS